MSALWRSVLALATGRGGRQLLFVALGVGIAFAALSGTLRGARALASGSGSLQTSTLKFPATADTYVRIDSPDTNFGSATSIQVDNSPVKHILLKFTVSGIGSGTVTSAKLRLHAVDGSNAGGDVHRALGASWSERTVTWKTAPAADPATVGSLGPVVVGTWYEVGVTPLVTGDGTVSLRMTSPSTDGAHYASKERGADLAPQLVVTVAGSAPPPGETIVFGAAGDVGGNSNSGKTLDAVKASGAKFLLLLGDVGYSEIVPESAWCSWAFSHLGSGYPLQLISGNHEADGGPDGRILEFAKGAPDRMSSTGTYTAEYFFDRGPVRLISIAANLQVGGVRYDYTPGNAHYTWLRDRIREAKAAGKWVVVGMHKVCLTAGSKSCEIGDALQDLLIAEKVDLVLQGHDHDYQRFHSLKCANPGSYDAACVADNGSDRLYARGAGTVFAISGTGGRSLTTINTADAEYRYVAAWMGGQTANRGNGFLKLTASSAELRGAFVNATNPSGYTDSFAISRSG